MTLYLDVELSKESLPGTEQNTSPVFTDTPPRKPSLFIIREVTDFGGTGTRKRGKQYGQDQLVKAAHIAHNCIHPEEFPTD